MNLKYFLTVSAWGGFFVGIKGHLLRRVSAPGFCVGLQDLAVLRSDTYNIKRLLNFEYNSI